MTCRKKSEIKRAKHSNTPLLKLGLLASVSIVWLMLRTGMKPSRIVYPCQRAALANVNIFVTVLAFPLVGLRPKILAQHIFKRLSFAKSATVAAFLLFLVSASTFPIVTTHPAATPVILHLQPQTALETLDASDLFIVQNASGAGGNMDAALSALIALMQNHDLIFFKTYDHPTGLIGKDDVIVVKVNGQSPQRGGTNTDIARSLIKTIISHPEGFSGEIVIADNGQDTGGIDMAESNAYDHSQSMKNVAELFPAFRVSAYSWYPIAGTNVNEYIDGDYADGYVVNSTANAVTGLRVSYPKFRTTFGTYVSFKEGVWNSSSGSYDSEKLKVINLPVFKTHSDYGATACVKNYMGVGSQTLTAEHDTVGAGGMGTQMVETRFPALNVIDCVWINANPFGSGSACGPFTTYDEASYTNLIGASTDPVALEYWVSKHVAIPAALQRGHSDTSSMDPDYAPVTPGLTQSYHNYLTYSMDQIRRGGYQATMLESEMNVYLATYEADTSAPSTAHDYQERWHNEDFRITLTATDTGSGISETYYRINGGLLQTTSSNGQPLISSEGSNNTLEYWSADNFGNEESPHSILTGVKLDKTAPTTGTPTRNPSDNVDAGQEVRVSVEADDVTSGVQNATLLFTANESSWEREAMSYNATTGLYEATISGQPEGTTVKYEIRTYDNAGNERTSDNAGEYYVYSVVPEFPTALAMMMLLAVLSAAIVLTKKSKTRP